MSFEIWRKEDLGNRYGQCLLTCYVIDTAMLKVVELSRGTTTKQVYNPKKKTNNPFGGGSYESVEVDNMYAVVDRGDKQSTIRGWGINGKYYPAVDCKRCNNTGNDSNAYNLPCSACKGASYKQNV